MKHSIAWMAVGLLVLATGCGADPSASETEQIEPISTAPAKGSVAGNATQIVKASYTMSKTSQGRDMFSFTLYTDPQATPCQLGDGSIAARVLALAPAEPGTYEFPQATMTFSYLQNGVWHNDVPGDSVIVVLSDLGDQVNGQIRGSFGASTIEGAFTAQKCPDRQGRSTPTTP